MIVGERLEARLSYGDVAVVIPCFNEECTVAQVVADALIYLPGATIYVYDNNSTDRTVQMAISAGAMVRRERRQGKGHVLRRAFGELNEAIVIIVDGDATYDLSMAPDAVELFRAQKLDFLNIRREAKGGFAYRFGHAIGNRMLTGAVRRIFGSEISDMLSGYKLLSRAFIKSFPVSSSGFEIETELTVHALELGVAVDEIAAPYRARPEGSVSKLSTIRDGWRIGTTILRLMQSERPFAFFGTLGLGVALASLGLGVPVFLEFLDSGLVPRFPTAFLAGFLAVISVLLFAVGLILDLVQKARSEIKKLALLALR